MVAAPRNRLAKMLVAIFKTTRRHSRDFFRMLFPLGFSRNRVSILDWSIVDLSKSRRHLPIRQTEFWRPVIDRFRNFIRTAFGIEYLVSYQPTSGPSSIGI